MIKKLPILITCLLLLTSASLAKFKVVPEESQAKTKAPRTAPQFSGQVFLRYSKGLTNSSTFNNFDLDRAYITTTGPVGKNASAKLTLDSTRDTGKLETFVKYAYVDLKKILKGKLHITGLTMTTRVGLQPTYWSSWVDKILGLRIVSKSLADLDAGIPSADFGVTVYGQAKPNEFINTNYLITILNGTGYNQAETNGGKTIAVRFDTKLSSYLTLGLGGQIENVSRSGSGDTLGNALLAYQAKIWHSYFELLYSEEAIGYSLAGLLDIHKLETMLPFAVFARLDSYDPIKETRNNERVRVILGASYLFNDQVKIIADYNNTTYGSASSDNAGQTISELSLRTQIDL